MSTTNANRALRILSVIHVSVASVVLVLAAVMFAAVIRQFYWWHLTLAISFAGYSAYLLSCAYAAWTRPSAAIVRDVSTWTALAALVLIALAVEQLRIQEFTLLSTGLAITSIPFVVAIYFALSRWMVRGI